MKACLIPFHPGQYFVARQWDTAVSPSLDETAGAACALDNRHNATAAKDKGFDSIFTTPGANFMINFHCLEFKLARDCSGC